METLPAIPRLSSLSWTSPRSSRARNLTLITAADGTVTSYSLASFATYGEIPDDWQKDASITGLTIGQGVTSIGESAFDGCDALVGNLVIPSSVNEISDGAFKDVGLSGTLTLGSYEETYELWWAEGNMDDTMIYTHAGVDYYANWYNGYPKMSGLFDPFKSPDGIVSTRAFKQRGTETAQYYVFNGPTLQNTVPAGSPIPAINNEYPATAPPAVGVLLPATDPAELTIQNFSNESGGDVTNHYWKQITQMTIGDNAFEGAGFTGLNIRGGITSIGDNTFLNCTSLATINCLAISAPTLGSNTFLAVSATQIHVPVGATGYGTTYGGLTVVYDL